MKGRRRGGTGERVEKKGGRGVAKESVGERGGRGSCAYVRREIEGDGADVLEAVFPATGERRMGSRHGRGGGGEKRCKKCRSRGNGRKKSGRLYGAAAGVCVREGGRKIGAGAGEECETASTEEDGASGYEGEEKSVWGERDGERSGRKIESARKTER